MIKYKFIFSFDLGKAIPQVGELCDSVNEAMHGFGFPENMVIRASIFESTATCKEELPPPEKQKIIDGILEILSESEKFKTWDFRFERIERI